MVWALALLFEAPFGQHLVFKGGTSLSKAYNVIRRFSEDLDVTFDIRAFAPDLLDADGAPLPKTKSQEKRWTSEVKKRLPEWVAEAVQPYFADAIVRQGLPATLRVDGDKLHLEYDRVATGTGYSPSRVTLEFGARSTGEPASLHDITCDAAGHVDGVDFPTAHPRVMHAERTFWEKATAIHVFCLQQRLRGDRFARHWYDLVRLDQTGFAARAIADRDLANAVATHKSIFFAEKAADTTPINYMAAIRGGLRLAPDGAALDALADDYRRMIEDRLLYDEPEPFGTLIDRCADIAKRANRAAD